jgi:hypothetical protein
MYYGIGSGLELCLVFVFGISNVETSGSQTTMLIGYTIPRLMTQICIFTVYAMRWQMNIFNYYWC